MKIPLSLLCSYVHLDEPISTLSETLTLLGLEVDSVENAAPPFSQVISAEVKSVHPHPSADKLKIATVFDGKREWQIVCGAKNCRPGLKTAFAPVGASVQGKIIRETAIRNVPSPGMLCSAEELGIPGDGEGILELPADMNSGQDLVKILWDPVFEISLTPNLGHCMSALGVARELSAALQKPIRHPKFTLDENSASRLTDRFKVSVEDTERCSRYFCRLIENVAVSPSPFWLKQTLLNAGFRPINNIVDITNYILIKTGQPLHAFDADKIEGGSITVLSSKEKKSFVGVDGIEREIPPGALFICDERGPIAIAGILGGARAAVSDQTQRVLLESAAFDAVSIRKTARAIDLRTESSQRFEKGIDWQGIPEACDEASQLMAEIGSGRIAKGTIDVKTRPFAVREIVLRANRVNQILGTQLSRGEIEEILRRLGCKTHAKDESALHVAVPTFRNDLNVEIDLVEEVARLYGYNHIEKRAPVYSTSQIPIDPNYLFERELRRRLTGQGLQEILTCNLISPKLSELIPGSSPIKVMHSKSEDFSILRSSLLPSHLDIVRLNLDQKNGSMQAFEIGRIHLPQGPAVIEIPMLGLVFYGKNSPHHWDRKPSDCDFYDLKGVIESLFEALSVQNIRFTLSSHSSFQPGQQGDLHADGLVIGSLGQVHPRTLERLGIKERVFFAELNLIHVQKLCSPHMKCKALSQFPSTERDWTIALPAGTLCSNLFDAIHSFHSPLLEKAELIDMYFKDKHNATIRFTYRDPLKTISFEEAEAVHAKLISFVTDHLACN